MNSTSIAVVFFLLIGGGFGCYYLFSSHEPASVTPTAAGEAGALAAGPATPAAVDAAKVLVTFFTVNEPCTATKKILELSEKAVMEGFPEEVKSGAVVFETVNTDLPENEHFLDDYEIGGKALVIRRLADGKEAEWMHCDEAWLLFQQPAEFLPYVQQPIRDYLAKK